MLQDRQEGNKCVVCLIEYVWKSKLGEKQKSGVLCFNLASD